MEGKREFLATFERDGKLSTRLIFADSYETAYQQAKSAAYGWLVKQIEEA